MRRFGLLLGAWLLLCAFAGNAAQAGNVIVGVNIWNENSLSPADQDAEIRQMAESGVKTIRTSLFPNTIDFVIKAYRQGIRSVVIVYPFLGSTAKSKGGWAQVPLSEVNPQEFTAAFKPLLDQLDAAGVRLAAIELGNEFNAATFNGDIASPGSGRVLGVRDLNNPADAEARVIAAGFRSYLKIMATLKGLRDHSKLNQGTPLILAGLAAVGPPSPKAGGWNKGLAVSHLDTIQFLRQNGLDSLVDGYGACLSGRRSA
jgi:hypothetical protein